MGKLWPRKNLPQRYAEQGPAGGYMIYMAYAANIFNGNPDIHASR